MMGEVHQAAASPVEDLKVTIQDVSLVLPFQETKRRSMFLSNIDQKHNFHVPVVVFHRPHKDFSPLIVAEKLKSGLAQALVPYDFMAGRLKLNCETGRLEIDCNGAGAGFAVASSECSLEDIGDLVYPHPAFDQLILLDTWAKDEQPLFVLQVTSFKGGGFAIGSSANHAALDGASSTIFNENICALAANKPLVVWPCNDRRLLAARSPPRVTFLHPEKVQYNISLAQEENSNNNNNSNNNSSNVNNNVPAATQEQQLDLSLPAMFWPSQQKQAFKLFRVTQRDLSNLKEKAKTHENAPVSSFNALVALLWWCKAISSASGGHDDGDDPDRICTILYPVDIRPRLIPPLPSSYAGNGVLNGYARAKLRELQQQPFGRLVEMVSEGAKRMTDQYIRSLIDWNEIYQGGFTHGDLLVAAWWKLGFEKVEPPWGRPLSITPLMCHRKDLVILLPPHVVDGDALDNNNNNKGKGVCILARLPSHEADKFESLFRSFLSTETGQTSGCGPNNIAHKLFSRI